MQSGSPIQAPGPSGQSAQYFGPLVIEATCAPRPVQGQEAFLLRCGAVLSSPRHVIEGQAQLVNAEGQSYGPVYPFQIQPGGSKTLQNPPTGEQWLVVDLTRNEIHEMLWGVLVGAAALTGLATYGTVRLVEDRVAAHRRKVARRRFFGWLRGE